RDGGPRRRPAGLAGGAGPAGGLAGDAGGGRRAGPAGADRRLEPALRLPGRPAAGQAPGPARRRYPGLRRRRPHGPAAARSPPLTTVRQAFAEVGRRSITLLLEQLATGEPTAKRVVVPAHLVVRASTAAPSHHPSS